jgi:hypothetical protein
VSLNLVDLRAKVYTDMCGKGWDALEEKIEQSSAAYLLNHDPIFGRMDGCDKDGSGGDFDDGCQYRMVIVRFLL